MKLDLPQIYPVASHTNNIGPGSTFVAIPGKKDDGALYIQQAIDQGAKKIVIDKNVTLSDVITASAQEKQVEICRVDNCRKELAQLSAQAWGNPAQSLKLVGVTGTKGKTSTAYITYYLLKLQGYKVALLSTAEKLINDDFVSLDLTTPLPDHLHAFFSLCKEKQIEFVVMEVSAQALSLHRVDGLEFEAGVFTNFSLEHLEFYASMEDYFAAKCKFFDRIKNSENMFINVDDPFGKKIIDQNESYSAYSLVDSSAKCFADIEMSSESLRLKIDGHVFHAPLVGQFNGSNLLAAISVVKTLGCRLGEVEKITAGLKQIPGRMEKYFLKNEATCFIDYAHNPSSFEAVLSTLRTMTDFLIVVFGAGGCRDKSKRPMMGAIAEKFCDIAIITSDNPRDEDPNAIAEDILAGFKREKKIEIIKELNRTTSIQLAYNLSKKGAVIAVLGKGRDEYQIVGDLTFPFKERSIIRPFMAEGNLYKSL